MSNWLEHTVQIEVEAPLERVWELWSDLEQMPQWTLWLESVKVLEDNPNLSRWQLATRGIKLSWLARTLKKVPQQIIQWEAVDGWPNRGAVRFHNRPQSSMIELTIAYAKPRIWGQTMDKLFLGRLVASTIRADLERFRQYAINATIESP